MGWGAWGGWGGAGSATPWRRGVGRARGPRWPLVCFDSPEGEISTMLHVPSRPLSPVSSSTKATEARGRAHNICHHAAVLESGRGKAGIKIRSSGCFALGIVVHVGRMKGCHKPSILQAHRELLVSHPQPPTQAPCTPALAHASFLDTDRTCNARATHAQRTRAHSYPHHWHMCHVGLY